MAGTEGAGQVRLDPTPLQCRQYPVLYLGLGRAVSCMPFFGVEYWDFGSVLDICRKLKAGTKQNRPKSLIFPQVNFLLLTLTAILELLEVVTGWEEPRGCEQGKPAFQEGEKRQPVIGRTVNHGPGVWRIGF